MMITFNKTRYFSLPLDSCSHVQLPRRCHCKEGGAQSSSGWGGNELWPSTDQVRHTDIDTHTQYIQHLTVDYKCCSFVYITTRKWKFWEIKGGRVKQDLLWWVLGDGDDILYEHAAAAALKPLDAVEHLRFITDAPNSHHCILYKNAVSSTLSVSQRRDLHMYLFVYKAVTEQLLSYLTSHLMLVQFILSLLRKSSSKMNWSESLWRFKFFISDLLSFVCLCFHSLCVFVLIDLYIPL